jgi:phosphoglycolate phosphatase-like HAD superfamily hydrolase
VLARIRTVLFDLDGTLTVPIIDFDAIRKKLELPPGTPLVHALTGLPPERYEAGMRVIHEAELEAAHNATANRGVHELLDALAARAQPPCHRESRPPSTPRWRGLRAC